MSEIKRIVVIRECMGCKKQDEHEINKEGWGDKTYGEAMRIWNEPYECPDCFRARIPQYYDYE